MTNSHHPAFSEPWAQAWADELRRSDDYRRAAAKWEGSIVLQMAAEESVDGVDGHGAVFVDLLHGDCRAARAATGDDLDGADFVLHAPLPVWKRVLAGEVEPIFGLMSGKIRLSRGSIARLTPFITASKELVRAAARVPTRFPDGDVHAPADAGAAGDTARGAG
jgi:putative sterol carrier protein